MKPLNLIRAALLCATTLACTSASANDWSSIRIGVEGAYPPFSRTNTDGTIEGFDIDIANALCAEMKATCTLVPQDWDGMIPALLARKYDAIIASMSITEERRQKVEFTNKYYHTPARFVAPKGRFTDISKAALAGKTVGVQRSTTHDKYLTDNYGDSLSIKRYTSQDDVYLDIKTGRLDLILADSMAVTDGFLNKEGGEGYELVGPALSDPRWFGEGAGIAVRKRDNDLREKFNQAIVAIRNNGTYQQIQDRYFNFNIYGD